MNQNNMLHKGGSLPLETRLDTTRIPETIRHFWSIIPRDLTIRSASSIGQDIASNDLFDDYYRTYRPIEYSFYRLIRHQRLRRTPIDPIKHNIYYDAVAFMANVVSIYNVLSQHAKGKLRGQLKSGLDVSDTSDGVGPLALEMSTATHLALNGWGVEFFDLESSGHEMRKFDFLASKDGQHIEIECKYVSHEAGMPVNSKKALRLIASIENDLSLFRHQGCRILVIRDKQGWKFSPQQTAEIFNVLRGNSNADLNTLIIESDDIRPNVIPSSEFGKSQALARDFIRAATGFPVDFAVAVQKNFGGSSIIVGLLSDKEVAFPKRLRKRLLEDTSRNGQFSGEFPASLLVQLAGVTEEEIALLSDDKSGQPHNLCFIANEIMQKRPHLSSVVFRGIGAQPRQQISTGLISCTTMLGGYERVIVYNNPKCAFGTSEINYLSQ